MKKSILFAFCSILIFACAAAAQDEQNRYGSSRLDNLTNQLKRQTVDLVDRTTEDLKRSNSNTRSDIEAAFLAQQLDASAGLFQQFARDNRRASELRDAGSILSDLTRRAPNYGSNNSLWRDAQRTVDDINRELGGSGNGGGNGGNGGGNGGNGGNGGGNGGNGGGQSSGSAFWRGTVDQEVQLVIRRRNIETRTISGTPYDNGTFSFASSLPTRNVNVNVIKKSGRGSVRVVQQPNRDNDYTTIIQVLDSGGGAREYQLEINWQ
ncbi:MAG: hypothetical protein M3T96_10400 [Acidobacteriota bacterium]|nr:hypothetical protein [Acidobacteriota bacterium]